jgi:ubiquinone/menaquinone biosynthesis C-methylase UbiE
MGWYDFFSKFYDRSLEHVYAAHRPLAAEALALEANSQVLDLPCGTGQSFDSLVPRLRHGALLGVDASRGMLARAEARAQRNGWSNVRCAQQDARALDLQALAAPGGHAPRIDRLHVFLGMTAFSDMEAAFERMWQALVPGGRCVIVDVHQPQLGVSGRVTNWVAQADMRRRFWEPLERVAESFQLEDLPYRREHGGQIKLATGIKPSGR